MSTVTDDDLELLDHFIEHGVEPEFSDAAVDLMVRLRGDYEALVAEMNGCTGPAPAWGEPLPGMATS